MLVEQFKLTKILQFSKWNNNVYSLFILVFVRVFNSKAMHLHTSEWNSRKRKTLQSLVRNDLSDTLAHYTCSQLSFHFAWIRISHSWASSKLHKWTKGRKPPLLLCASENFVIDSTKGWAITSKPVFWDSSHKRKLATSN